MVPNQSGSEEGGTEIGRSGVAALLACGLFITVGLFSPGLVLPQIEREFTSLPNAALLTELVGTLASFAFALGAPVAGMLVGRYGCRKVILPGLVGFALFGAMPALLSNIWLILACRVGIGLFLAAIFTGSLGGIGALHPKLRARMFGWFSVAGGASAILLFPLIGAIGHLGWRPAFLVNLISLLALPLVALLPATLARTEGSAAPAAQAGNRTGLLNPAMVGLLLLAALTGMGMVVAPIYAPLYLASTGVTDTAMLAIPVTLGSIGAVFASASYGAAHQRIGLIGVSTLTLLVMGLAMLTVGSSDGFATVTAAVIVQSSMIALMAPNVNASALAYSPAGKGAQAMGVANGVMFGSQLAVPFITAWIRDMAGLPGVFLAFGATMLCAGILTATRFRARRDAVAPA